MKIKTKEILPYFLIWISFMYHGSILKSQYSTLMDVVAIVAIIYVLSFHRETREKGIVTFLGLLLVNIVFVRYINGGGLGITIWTRWMIQIMSIYSAYLLNKEDFFTRFIKFMAFYAGISLVCFTLQMIGIWKIITPSITYGGMQFKGILPLHVAGLHGDKVGRNLGVFYEPGLYQIPLNTALYFILFFQDKMLMSIKKQNKYFILILLALITTKSTTGYIAFAAIYVCYMLTTTRSKKQKGFIILASLAVIILIDSLLNGENSILYNVVIGKLFDENGFNLAASGSGFYRVRTIEYVMEVIRKYPLGAGYDIYNAFILFQKQYLNELVGVECLKAFAYYGTPQMILTYVYLAKTAWKRKRNIIQWILVVFLYINTTMAQSEIFYPSLIILLLLNGDSEKSSTSK